MHADKPHLSGLDGLRALACLVVVGSHLRDFQLIDLGGMGYFGVMLFFSLSGFLMGYLYLHRNFNAVQIVDYAIARFARIAPIYLIVILAAWVIHQYVWSGFIYATTDGNLARHLLFTGDVSVFWSIPPEVQFYGVFILLWGCWAIYRQEGNAAPLFIAAIAVFATIVFGQWTPGTFVASKIQFFAVGLIAAVIRRNHPSPAIGNTLMAWMQVFALAIFVIVLFPSHAPFVSFGSFEYYADLRLALLTGAMTWLFSYETPFSRVIFGNRAAVAIGAWSFSLYLLHAPILQLSSIWLKPSIGGIAAGIAGTLISIFASFLSYRALEAPLRRLTREKLSGLAESRGGMVRKLDIFVCRFFAPSKDPAN
jgi:peptidoglycan/LPS O-acetylase OafA/YrhL